MLPRSARLLARSTPPPPAAFRLASSAASATLLVRRLAPSAAASSPAAGPSTGVAVGRRPFASSPSAPSAKRDWENQAAGPKGAAKEGQATGEGEEGSTTAASLPSADERPPSDKPPVEGESTAEEALDRAAHVLKPDESVSPAAVHEGVLPSTADAPASEAAPAPSLSPAESAPAEEATTSTSTSSDSPSSSSLSDPSSSSIASASASNRPSSTAAKLASKARQKVRRATKAGSSSATAPDVNGADAVAGEGSSGEVRDLPSYNHTLVLPVTSSMLPPYRKNFTFTEPSVIRAVRSLASARIDQLGVFLLRPVPVSSSTSSAAAEANPRVENVDVIHSTNEVYSTGLLCRIKSSRPGTVTRQDDGTELVSSWNVELEPVRRIVLTEVEVGRDAPESEGLPVTVDGPESEASASGPAIGRSTAAEEVEEEGEGDVASFEKVDSKAGIEVTAPTDPLELLRKHAVSIGAITHVAEPSADESSAEVKELKSLYIQDLKDWAGKSPQDVQSAILELSHASGGTDFFHRKLADQLDIVAGLAPHATNADRQAVLDATDLAARLRAVLFIMKKELYDIEVRNKIHREMKQRLDERQKEMILGEQMRAIKKELGHDKANGKDELVEKFRQQAEGLRMPDEVAKTFEAEMSKLAMLDQNSSEFNVVRNYLDWIVSVPWGKRTVDSFSIPSSIKILNEDHYGLTDVKDRILEFLAVGKLRGTVEGKILCLVGPPGVGKTSIAKSIARALDRRFYRISVGGLRDVAEIKGHRRTYVAAMPGKAVQALKQTQAENPLILIDEIDKMSGGAGGGGGSWGGDPSSALLEMLDPEQNGAFTDHYLDLPVDLSKVLFVCTANMLSTIPAPLLDRMEVLEVSGYVSEEKRAIAKGYLAPQAKKSSGLEKADVEVDDSAVNALIQYYCRESGVRNLKKHIEKIYRKAAFKIVKDLVPDGAETAAAGVEHPAVEVIEPTAADAAPSTVQGAVPEPALSTVTAEEASEPVSQTAAAETSTTVPAGSTTLQVVKPLEVPASISMRITKDNLKDYVGPPVYQKDRIYPFAPPPGVSNGLGYTGNGAGALMPIEITVMPGKGSIQTTGKLGEVIKESVNIAISYLRANAFALGIAVNEGDIVLGGSSDRDIHLHMPEGAIGKDGPSAGVAILTALVSLMTKTRVDPDIAMTGEISLGGQVLPVGGLKEKILAAHRANIKKLIVPQACQGDIEENVHASVKDGIDIVYVSNVREVLYEVFGQLPVADSWKDKYPLLELYGAADGPAPTSPSSTLNAS